MRAVLQRVSRAKVAVDEQTVGRIDTGWLILLGVAHGDTQADAQTLCDKIVALRAFEDDAGKMNHDLRAVGGAALVVSQFTLLADTRKGRRPSFTGAAAPDEANALYEWFCQRLRDAGIPTQTGRFGAMMQVELVNDGPVTFVLDTRAETP